VIRRRSPAFHFAAQCDDRYPRSAQAFRNGVAVIDPGGQDENIGAVVCGGQDVPDDLVEAFFVGDQGTVDLCYAARSAGICVTDRAESGRVQAKHRMGRCDV
jgi:hypothetical protein